MRRLLMASMTLVLVFGAGGTFAADEEGVAFPAGSDVTFVPAAPWSWRALEPEWDCGPRYPRQPFYGGAEVAADGRVWFLDRGHGIRELGSCPIAEPAPSFNTRDQALGPDGTLWLINDDRLWSWDGMDWQLHLEGFNQPGRSSYSDGGYSYSIDCDLAPCYFFVDVAPDGTVWLSGSDVSAFDGTSWTDYLGDPPWAQVLGFGPDGAVWVQGPDAVYVIEPSAKSPAPAPGAAEAVPTQAPVGAADLESLLGSIPGLRLDAETWNGLDWVARFDPVMHADANAIRGAEALVAAAGVHLEDLAIETGVTEPRPGNYAAISAVRVPGVPATGLINSLIAAMAPHIEDPQVRWERLADRWVALVRDGAMPGAYPMTFYPAGDTTWVVQADRPLVETIVAAIPDPPRPAWLDVPLGQPVEIPEVGIAASFPRDWTVKTDEADLGFIVLTGPERFGPRTSMYPVLAAEPPQQEPDVFEACTLVMYRPASLTPGEYLADIYGKARDIEIESLGDDLAVVHIDELASSGQRLHAQYVKTVGDGIAVLWCWSPTLRADQWRAIAESIRLLPEEGT